MRKPALCRKMVIFLLLFAMAWYFFVPEPAAMATVKISNPLITSVRGSASYYSYECASNPMANGKPFDPEKRTCASWFYKFGTVLIVKSLDTGRTTEVVVTDRGPNKRLVKAGRIIDLSKRAFEDICDLEKGLTMVTVTVKSRNRPSI